MTAKTTRLQPLIYDSFLSSALIPFVVIEVVLLSIYFGINHYISAKHQQALLAEVTRSMQEIAGREANGIDNQLKDVTRHAIIMQNDHQLFFRNAGTCALPNGEPRLARHENGALFKTVDNGGSSVYYSSLTHLGPAEMHKVRCSEVLDPLLKSIVNSTPIICQAYLNTWDDMTRIYPFLPDAPEQFGPELRVRDYNFYYEADERHDPERKPVWTGAYLDPAGQGWMVSVIVPIYNGSFLEGVSGLDVTVDSFIKHVLDLHMPWQGMPFLVDDKGRILAMPESVGKLFSLRELTSHQYTSNIAKTIEKPSEYSIFHIGDESIKAQMRSMFDTRTRFTEIAFAGKTYLASQEIVPETGWRLIVLVDEAVIFAKIRELSELTSAIGYGAIALMFLFYVAFFLFLRRKSIRMASRISAPIERLAQMTTTIVGQRQPCTFEEAGIAEIDNLGQNFCRMSDQLNRRTQELIESHIRERNKEYEAEKFEQLAITDRLTGIYNRHKLDMTLQGEIDRSRRNERQFGVMMLDIDHFKKVNDTYGHPVGDIILKDLAQLLLASIRSTDVVGRWGGEEFMIICPETDENGLLNLAEKLRQTVDGHDFPVARHLTVSFGLSINKPDDRIQDIMSRADKALYTAKHEGRNRVELFTNGLQ